MQFSATIISKTTKALQDENQIKVDMSMIRKLILILFIILILFTILYFTCFGCFLVLNDSTSRAAQTVTLSSEGPANETYPLSMGEYQLAEEEIHGWGVGGSLTVYNWYRHKDREDRFLMYNNRGKIVCNNINIFIF